MITKERFFWAEGRRYGDDYDVRLVDSLVVVVVPGSAAV